MSHHDTVCAQSPHVTASPGSEWKFTPGTTRTLKHPTIKLTNLSELDGRLPLAFPTESAGTGILILIANRQTRLQSQAEATPEKLQREGICLSLLGSLQPSILSKKNPFSALKSGTFVF